MPTAPSGATAAGVSPGLVNHHFGSKDGLRAEYDAQVIKILLTQQRHALAAPQPAGVLTALSEVEQYAPLVAYIVHSFQAGGELATALFEQMVADTEQYLADGVAERMLKPSRDPAARARYLTLTSVGSLLLYMQLQQDRAGPPDYGQAIRDMSAEMTLPALELYTEGMFTDSSLLDGLLAADATTTNEVPQ